MKMAFLGDIHADSTRISSRLDDSRETLTVKMEQIRKICISEDVTDLFLEGDVFNRPNVAPECISRMGKEFKKFALSGIEVHSIVGNHDIARNDLSTLENSALGLLGLFGAVDVMNKPLERDGYRVIPCHYTQKPEPAPDDGMTNILIAHMFYDKGEMFANDFANNLSREDAEKLNCRYIFLGHDHEPYASVKLGNTAIIRTGSLLRMTRNQYNYNRSPSFATIDETGALNIYHLKCAPFSEIVASRTDRKNIEKNEIMADLASRLASGSEKTEDGIMKCIMNDSKLSSECRELILSYLEK